MSAAEQMLFEFADELNTKRDTRRRAVIEPPVGEYPNTEIFADEASVMSPASLTIQDSKGAMDLSNIPVVLQKLADAINSSTNKMVSIDLPVMEPEQKALEDAVEKSAETKLAVQDLARMMETQLDDLSDTTSLVAKRQIEEARRTTTAVGLVDETQQEMLEYQKEKDFDDSRPISNPTPLLENEDPVRVPDADSGGGGLFGMGRGTGLLGMLGFAARGLTAFGVALAVANTLTQQFFGKNLFEAVTDGFKYLLDNWEKLVSKGISGLFDIVMDLPSLIGKALLGIGKVVGSVLMSVLRAIPGLGSLLPNDSKEMFEEDASGQDMFDRSDNTTKAVGAAASLAVVATKTGRSALGKTASLLSGGLIGGKTSAASVAEDAIKAPAAGKQGLMSKGFQALKSHKYGKAILATTVAATALATLFSDDEDEQKDQAIKKSPDTPDSVMANSDYLVPEESTTPEQSMITGKGFGLAETAATAALTAAGIYAYTNRSVSKMMPPGITGPQVPLPKPGSGSVGEGSKVMKAGTSAAKSAAKGIGTIAGKAAPGLNIAMAGYDVYSAATDDSLTQHEKNTQYAGAGGTLAGAAAGGTAGASIGFALGSVVPILGNAVGAAIGGVLGSVAGALLGESAVESAYDYVLGPEESEGQSLTETGVGIENLKEITNALKEVSASSGEDSFSSDGTSLTEGLAMLDSIPGIPEMQSSSAPTYAGPYSPEHMPTPDEKAMYSQDVAKLISEKSLGTTNISKLQETLDEAAGINPEVLANTSYSSQPSMDNILYNGKPIGELDSNAVTEQPNLETGIDDGEDIREQTAIQPEIIVNVAAPVAAPKKKQGVVAKKIMANKPTEKSRTGFADKPSLSNVPVIVDDTGFILLNQGYV